MTRKRKKESRETDTKNGLRIKYRRYEDDTNCVYKRRNVRGRVTDTEWEKV